MRITPFVEMPARILVFSLAVSARLMPVNASALVRKSAVETGLISREPVAARFGGAGKLVGCSTLSGSFTFPIRGVVSPFFIVKGDHHA